MLRRLPVFTVVVLALFAAVAGAADVAAQTLPIQSASLTQDGRLLVWSVTLAHPFSPAGMKRSGQSLCLQLEAAGAARQLCVSAPLPGRRQPQLQYVRAAGAGAGPAQAIAATVTRTSTRNLVASFLPASVGLGYRPVRWQVVSAVRASACRSPVPGGAGCVARFPSAPALTRVHSPQPVGCTVTGAPFVYSGPSSRREIALTFDDGPWPDTPQFLDILEREHVPATFFEIGNQVSEYGQGGAVQRRMLADGDMIGDHTWNHADVAGGGAFAAGEISQTAAAIRKATGGFTPCLFRAPYGAVSPALIAQARLLGFTTIQWNVDPRDWALPGADAIYGNVVANAHNGAIILQHDGGGNRSETLAALPREIATLRSEGYQFVTVTALLGQRLLYQ